VLHHSTDILMIGIFTEPTRTNIERNLSAFSWLLNESCKDIKPRYIINSIKVDTILASQTHQVPHVGIPHIDPEISAINVVIAPMGAIDLTRYAESLTFHIRKIALAIAIAIYKD
jgi:hypothetical protein